MKRLFLIVALALGACHTVTEAPSSDRCVEFEHYTMHHGKQVICRMLWCEEDTISTSGDFHYTGGVAALFCDEAQ